ncbi:MAG: siderophore-interacting protein [Pseudomonadota bacterium]
MADLKSSARFSVQSDEALLAFWRHELDEHGFEYHTVNANWLEIETPFGTGTIRSSNGNALIDIQCDTIDDLIGVREAITHHLLAFDANLANVQWDQTHDHAPALPNFCEARVSGVERLNGCYWRVILATEHAHRLIGPGLHFRLLRRQDVRRPPVWPSMTQRGIPSWPTGPDKLIQTHYTVRSVDAVRSQVVFDAFIHPEGATCDWVAGRPLGERVGLLGPGGGLAPVGDWLLLGGDETAVPAVARIVETLPPDTEGEARLLVPSLDHVFPIENPSRVSIHWLSRARDDKLCDAVVTTPLATQRDYRVWFAGSYDDAQAVRQHYRHRDGIEQRRVTAIAFW